MSGTNQHQRLPYTPSSRSSEDISTDNTISCDDLSSTTAKTSETQSDISEPDNENADPIPSKLSRVKALGHQVKSGPKRLATRLDVFQPQVREMDADDSEVGGITDNPAFNVGNIAPKQQGSADSAATKTAKFFKRTGDLIAHPERTYKKAYANKMVASEHEFLTTDSDAEFLQAHDDLQEIMSLQDAKAVGDYAVSMQSQRIEQLQQHRERLRAAWITSKHVKRVRAVPYRPFKFPHVSDYPEIDSEARFTRKQWLRYLGELALYYGQDFAYQYIDDSHNLPFDRSALVQHVERLSIASAPWQTWLVSVYDVFCWNDPWCTGKWLAIYTVVWYNNFIMTFVYLYITYVVLRNRYRKDEIEELRQKHERVIDKEKNVLRFNEAQAKHGKYDWLDPVLDELGPPSQLQLGDLADFAEVLVNFYEWRSPRATVHCLIFFTTCAVTSAVTSLDFSMKVFWFLCGLYFFVSRPIATLYPRFRHAISPFKWAFWDVPTNAEWAFSFLRQEALKSTAKSHLRPLDPPSSAVGSTTPTVDIFHDALECPPPPPTFTLTFRGRHRSHLGRLHLTATHLSFHPTTTPSTPLWTYPLTTLLELRKTRSASFTHLSFQNALALRVQAAPAEELLVEAMLKRDECFNALLGLSGRRWQLLRTLPADARGGEMTWNGVETGNAVARGVKGLHSVVTNHNLDD